MNQLLVKRYSQYFVLHNIFPLVYAAMKEKRLIQYIVPSIKHSEYSIRSESINQSVDYWIWTEYMAFCNSSPLPPLLSAEKSDCCYTIPVKTAFPGLLNKRELMIENTFLWFMYLGGFIWAVDINLYKVEFSKQIICAEKKNGKSFTLMKGSFPHVSFR